MRDETGRVTLGWLRWLKAPGLRSGHYVFEGSNPSPVPLGYRPTTIYWKDISCDISGFEQEKNRLSDVARITCTLQREICHDLVKFFLFPIRSHDCSGSDTIYANLRANSPAKFTIIWRSAAFVMV